MKKRKWTGNYAWDGTNGIYLIEIAGEGYIPIFPKDHGCKPWEPRRAMQVFLDKIADHFE